MLAFFAGDWALEFQAYLGFLEMSELKGDQQAAAVLRESGTSCAVLHFSQVYPLVPARFLPLLEKSPRAVMVEGNSTGQLARLIRQETGFVFAHQILRYDGLPFTARYILDRLGSEHP